MPKILIIEDDPLIIKIYTTRLTADGYQVLSAENGQDGLKLALAEIHPIGDPVVPVQAVVHCEFMRLVRTRNTLR